MKSNKGFTLIEIAVVLAIIAILAAILTPIVTSYIDQARVTRAGADTKKIAEAVLLFKRDTGVFPGYKTYALAKVGDTPLVDCLVTGSSSSSTYVTLNSTYLNSWTCNTAQELADNLNTNTMGITTSAGTGGAVSYRGPYLDGLNGSDPWGNPYIVNSAFLAITGANVNHYAFAASAGPNGLLETAQSQAEAGNVGTGSGFATLGDDITSLIK